MRGRNPALPIIYSAKAKALSNDVILANLKKGTVWIILNSFEVCFVMSEKMSYIFGGAIAQSNPNDFGWNPKHKASLMKV